MVNDWFKWIIIAAVFLLAFSGGYLIFQSFKPKAPAWQPVQQVPPPEVQSPSPTPGVSGVSSANATTLPRTGAPIGLMAIFATSAIISGWGLSKFPK